MADVAREARASIAALVEAYRARPTTIYVRIVLLASTIFYDWLLFGKQLRPTKDLFIADSEKFVNRWKNMAFSFQIIVAFIPLLGVGTVTPFLVSQRERDEPRAARSASFGSLIAVTRRDAPGAARDTFGARVAPCLAILAVETAIGAAVVGVGMSVANVVLRFRCFWDMLGLSLATLAVHAAFFCALSLFFETLEPSWLSVSHIVVVLAETQMSGYAITPAFMKGRGKWFTYLSSLRYAYDAECRMCVGQWYPQGMKFQRGAGEHWNNVPFDFGVLALFWLFWVLCAFALAYRRFGSPRSDDGAPAGYGALDDGAKARAAPV